VKIEKLRFLKKVRIREQTAWQFRQYIVDVPLSWFPSRNQKNNSKEKPRVCMTKKDLLIGGRVGVGRQTV
jgi:hypothetical protein